MTSKGSKGRAARRAAIREQIAGRVFPEHISLCSRRTPKLKRQPEVDGDIVRIFLTRGKVAIVDLIDAELGQFNWRALHPSSTANVWYAARRPGVCNIHLHRVVAQRAGLAIDGMEVDHRDGDGLNCRRSNLRSATRIQNCHNARLGRRNKSGVKGVFWDRRVGRWRAFVLTKKKRKWLGYFDALEEAATARANAELKHHGEFARLV